MNLKITVILEWCKNRGMLNLKTVLIFYSKFCLKIVFLTRLKAMQS